MFKQRAVIGLVNPISVNEKVAYAHHLQSIHSIEIIDLVSVMGEQGVDIYFNTIEGDTGVVEIHDTRVTIQLRYDFDILVILRNDANIYFGENILSDNPPPLVPPPTPVDITTAILSDGVVGTAYSQTLVTTGSPDVWTLEFGNLPDGLTLDANLGTISGIPTVVNTFTFTIKAVNSVNLLYDVQSFTVRINEPIIEA